jgi:effector-binding domain-containing protein
VSAFNPVGLVFEGARIKENFENRMPVHVELTSARAIPLAVVRRRARRSELATVVPQGCGVVWDFIRRRGIKAGRHVALYLNDNIDLEVGVEVTGAFDEQDDVVCSSTPAGPVASAVHFGPYQNLGIAHDAIRAWCAAHSHTLLGPNWEIYGHWQPEWNDDPSSIRTDVFYQVAPVSNDQRST